MRDATKEQSIKAVKAMIKRRLIKKGHDLNTFSEKWLEEKALEILNDCKADKIKILEVEK